MFKIKIENSSSQKEIRLSEEDLKRYVSKFVISQAKTMGHAKATISENNQTSHWHIQYFPHGDGTNCQS